MQSVNICEKKKPFTLLKTRQELLRSRKNDQLEFAEGIERDLDQFGVNEVLAAEITVNSPSKVVSVKSLDTPDKFSEAFF